ncbi:MAG: hypothetical protein QXQ57_00770 [Sulfolobales archaeon]
MPKCEKGHPMGFEARCNICGSRISYSLSMEELVELPAIERPREDASILLVDLSVDFPLQQISPRGIYVLNITLGDSELISDGMIMLRRLRSRLWPEYFREYRDRLSLLLKIHGVGWSSNRLVIANLSSPLALLITLTSEIDPSNSLLISLVPGEEAPAPEAVNSYSAIKAANRKGIPTVIVTEGFVKELTGYSEELGYIEERDALAYISRYFLASAKEVFRAVSEDRDLGIRYYGLTSIIGAHPTVFKNPLSAMRSLLYRLSIDLVTRNIQSVHVIAAAPKEMLDHISSSYKEFIRGFGGLLNHTLSLVEKEGRLGTYDLIALVGFMDKPEFEWLRKAYDTLKGRNPEIDIDKILGV